MLVLKKLCISTYVCMDMYSLFARAYVLVYRSVLSVYIPAIVRLCIHACAHVYMHVRMYMSIAIHVIVGL